MLALGVFVVRLATRQSWFGMTKLMSYGLLGFGAVCFLGLSVGLFLQHYNVRSAYGRGQYSLIEGIVEDFEPMPWEGHRDECFSVKQHRFCYSDFGSPTGFHNSASHGGPIRAGLPVRIGYVDDTFVRIDIKWGQLP